jgi:hypothetical protein
MFKSAKARVLLVLVAVLILSTAAVPAASAGTLAAPSSSQLSANKAGGWGCSQTYVVRRGDNLSRIAYRFGTTVNALMQCNNIWDPDVIYWGQTLCICGGYHPKPAPKPAPRPAPCQWGCSGSCQPGCPLPPPPPPPPPAPCGGFACPGPAPIPCGGPVPCTNPNPCNGSGCNTGPSPWPPVQPPSCTVGGTCCTDTRSVITSPRTGSHVSGWVTVYGTAVHQDFDYYKLEYGAGSNPNEWSWFQSGEYQVANGALGTFNASALPCGTYSIRLTVVDSDGNYPTPCQVTVTIP